MSPFPDNGRLFLHMKIDRLEKRIRELEATLRRVEALPDKWRKKTIISSSILDFNFTREACAKELEEALGGSPSALKGETKK